MKEFGWNNEFINYYFEIFRSPTATQVSIFDVTADGEHTLLSNLH